MSLSDLSLVQPDEVEDAGQLLYDGFASYAAAAGVEHKRYPVMKEKVEAGAVHFWRGHTGIIVLSEGTQPGRLMLSMFALHPDYHHSGLGAEMMNDVIAYASNAGFAELELYTRERFDHLRRFYERQGFVLERTGPHLEKPDGAMRIFMVRSLV